MRRGGGTITIQQRPFRRPHDCFAVKGGDPFEIRDFELESRLVVWIRSLFDDVAPVAPKVAVVHRHKETESVVLSRVWMVIESESVVRTRPPRVAMKRVPMKIEIKFEPPKVDTLNDPPPLLPQSDRSRGAKPRMIPASAAAASMAKKAPKKNKAKKPKNICWYWHQDGTCPVEQKYGHCKMSHDEDWKAKGGRGE
jgi:hypothetical protein